MMSEYAVCSGCFQRLGAVKELEAERDRLKADLQRHKDALARVGGLIKQARKHDHSCVSTVWRIADMFDSDGYIWPIEGSMTRVDAAGVGDNDGFFEVAVPVTTEE